MCTNAHMHTAPTMTGEVLTIMNYRNAFIFLGEEVGGEPYTHIWHASWICLLVNYLLSIVCGRSRRSMMLEYPTPYLLFPNISTFRIQLKDHPPVKSCLTYVHVTQLTRNRGPGMVSE